MILFVEKWLEKGKVNDKVLGRRLTSWSLRSVLKFASLVTEDTLWCRLLRHWATSRKFAGSIPDGVIGIVHWHYGPDVHSASNRHNYQEHFLGRKGGRCIELTTLSPTCAVLKSGNLKFLEPSGPFQACNGIALPLPWRKWVVSAAKTNLLMLFT